MSVKEELVEIGPVVLQPPDSKYMLRPLKLEPGITPPRARTKSSRSGLRKRAGTDVPPVVGAALKNRGGRGGVGQRKGQTKISVKEELVDCEPVDGADREVLGGGWPVKEEMDIGPVVLQPPDSEYVSQLPKVEPNPAILQARTHGSRSSPRKQTGTDVPHAVEAAQENRRGSGGRGQRKRQTKMLVKEDLVDSEPVDGVGQEVRGCGLPVKEDMDIGPVVLQPPDSEYALRLPKLEPGTKPLPPRKGPGKRGGRGRGSAVLLTVGAARENRRGKGGRNMRRGRAASGKGIATANKRPRINDEMVTATKDELPMGEPLEDPLISNKPPTWRPFRSEDGTLITPSNFHVYYPNYGSELESEGESDGEGGFFPPVFAPRTEQIYWDTPTDDGPAIPTTAYGPRRYRYIE